MVTKGKIRPIRDHVIVSDMDFGVQKTASGIVIQSDNGKSRGVKPRWGKVWAIGPEQNEVTVGDWICVEHGRWTRAAKINDGEQELIIHRVDTEGILASSEQAPSADDVVIGHSI
jgi:co-chaperonin GroES (HSP10)